MKTSITLIILILLSVSCFSLYTLDTEREYHRKEIRRITIENEETIKKMIQVWDCKDRLDVVKLYCKNLNG